MVRCTAGDDEDAANGLGLKDGCDGEVVPRDGRIGLYRCGPGPSARRAGERVRVLDNLSRGNQRRLGDVVADVEFVEADVRDAAAVSRAAKGIDCVVHAAFVNGTQFFYSMPQLVLDVGIRGMLNVLDACLAHEVPELFVASSSEVYQTPPRIPTDETVPLSIPDPMNPRYSYAAGKITSEMLAINYARTHFERMVIFRPHNVYGPDMGWEHVIPQFVLRLRRPMPWDRGARSLRRAGNGERDAGLRLDRRLHRRPRDPARTGPAPRDLQHRDDGRGDDRRAGTEDRRPFSGGRSKLSPVRRPKARRPAAVRTSPS